MISQPDTASTSARRLVAEAQTRIESISVAQLRDELEGAGIVLVDLREQAEREVHGTIPAAIHVPRGMLEFCADPELPIHADELEPSRRIVVYCAVGNRSALAAQTLAAMGFTNVAHLAGGFSSWRSAGGAIEVPPAADTGPWSHLLAHEPTPAGTAARTPQ
jgi:rhodanese-related sulfurtransferase